MTLSADSALKEFMGSWFVKIGHETESRFTPRGKGAHPKFYETTHTHTQKHTHTPIHIVCHHTKNIYSIIYVFKNKIKLYKMDEIITSEQE